MKLTYIFLVALFILGCGDPADTNKKKIDYFREDALKLSRAGMLKNYQGEKLDSLIAVYKKDSVNGLKELLVAGGDLLKIHIALNGRSVDDVYRKICDTIGMKYPGLKCDEVQTSVILYADRKDTEWVVAKVRFGETWYERKLYYLKKMQVDDLIYRIYNRKLADDGKPQRLHLVQYSCVNCNKGEDEYMGNTDITRSGFLLLNKAQKDSLDMIPALEIEDENNEFNIYTTVQMNEELKKFEASGLVETIGAAWYAGAKNDVLQSSVYQQTDLYDFFDTLFSYTSFDTSNLYNPYEEILASLATVSRGKFTPTNIVDEETGPLTRKVRFTFEKDIYEFEAKTIDRFLFPGIIDNVNKALADHKAGGAFYTVSTYDDVCRLIYIDDDKVEKVKASGFFIFLEKGPSQEMKDKWGHSVVVP